MTNLIWSAALAGVGIVGLWLAGSQRRAGWAVGFAAQLLWIVFALVSGQYGFIVSAVAYGFVYARNFWRARLAARRTITVTLKADVSQFTASMEHAARAARRLGDSAQS